MKNWNLIFRRTHLYLGMLLIPWMLIYALSTFIFNHAEYFRQFRASDPQWLPLWEKEYTLALPPGNEAPRETARRVLEDQGLRGAFGAQRQGSRLNINLQNFWQPLRLNYDSEKKILRAEKKKFVWFEVLTRLHERTGYGHPGFLNNIWAVMVDVFCVTTLVWIGTGLYLWWKLTATRRWGAVTIGSGGATLLLLLWSL